MKTRTGSPVAKADIRGLYAVIDSAYAAFNDLEKTAGAIISGGARIIQLRAKGLPSGAMLEAARALREITLQNGVTFIVNDRVDVAMMSRADGVHLGQEDIPLTRARALMGDGAIIGVSTHNAFEAVEAQRNGADYISLGPIFPTKTKKDAHDPLRLEGLREMRAIVSLPIVAIGGITGENVIDVLTHGGTCAAMISEILAAKDVLEKTAEIVARINSFK